MGHRHLCYAICPTLAIAPSSTLKNLRPAGARYYRPSILSNDNGCYISPVSGATLIDPHPELTPQYPHEHYPTAQTSPVPTRRQTSPSELPWTIIGPASPATGLSLLRPLYQRSFACPPTTLAKTRDSDSRTLATRPTNIERSNTICVLHNSSGSRTTLTYAVQLIFTASKNTTSSATKPASRRS